MNNLLELKFNSSELGREATVLQWFLELAWMVWKEHEDFSGKRPWGAGGWEGDLYNALAREGLVNGTPRGDGWFDDIDYKSADDLLESAFESLLGRKIE